jgi:hypothetical protein
MSSIAVVRGVMILSTVAWAVGETLMRRSAALDRLARATWTVGIALAVLHVVLAFHVVYSWNHEAAIVATTRQMIERFGWGWRGAIHVNYAFLALWTADVFWWWFSPRSHASRAMWLETARRVIFAIMFFNGAVVFATGVGRFVGMASLFLVLIALFSRRPRTVYA